MSNQQQSPDNKKCCALCPVKLGTNSPSPHAIESVLAVRSHNALSRNKRSKTPPPENLSCPWYINSAEHNYCFWVYAQTLSQKVSDREICQLLGISLTDLKETFDSALEKIKNNTDEKLMQEFVDLITEQNAHETPTDEFDIITDDGDTIEDDEAPEEDEVSEVDLISEISVMEFNTKKSRRNRSGMPLHRDGKKVDLYNIGAKDKKDKP